MKVKAFVNHGRWIANCPNCKGAEIVHEGAPFICYSEYMQLLGRDPDIIAREMERARRNQAIFEVEFPKNKSEIDDVLNRRKEENRNWTNESIDELRKENIDNGVGV